MFDIGFSELVVVAVVGLLVIGPERLPGTIRTASHWLNRLRRGFNDIKREVQQELHNDEVMQELRRTGQQIKTEADTLSQGVASATAKLEQAAADATPPAEQSAQPSPEPPVQTADKHPE